MDEKTNKMEVGEEFLSIKLAGHGYVKAFPNKEKTAENQPDFKGDGVAVWKQKKKATTTDDPTISDTRI